KSGTTQTGKIHPVVIYPFKQPGHYSDLEELYQLIARLDADKHTYARPITVVDRKTHYAMEGNKAFLDFRKNTMARHSDILDAWCVDTCQMWCSGLGTAFSGRTRRRVLADSRRFQLWHGGRQGSLEPAARPAGNLRGTAAGHLHRRDCHRPQQLQATHRHLWNLCAALQLVSLRSQGNPPIHRAAPVRILRGSPQFLAGCAATTLVSLLTNDGHVVTSRFHPPA